MPLRRFLPSLALILLAMDARALGIGEIISQPRLGERLRIELRLNADDQPIDPACIRLSPGEGADDLPWVRNARLRVMSGARPTVIVESAEPVNHPIYMLGLRLGCGSEVRREFAMMPQPPIERAGDLAMSPDHADRGAATRGAAQPIATGAAEAAGGWPIAAGETLTSIAAALHPGNRRAQKAFIRESIRANTRLFRDVADPANHPLPAGENLTLPGTGPRSAVPPRPARPSVQRPSRKPDRRGDEPDAPLSRPERPLRQAPSSRGEDRLMVASGTDEASGLKFSTMLSDSRSRGLTEEQREKLRQEQRLIAQLDEKIIASLALAEKIRNMEDYLEKLQGDMSRLDQQIKSAGTSTPAVASPAPAPPAAETPAPKIAAAQPAPRREPEAAFDWQTYGLIAAAVLLIGALLWRRRQASDAADESADIAAAEAGEAEVQSTVAPIAEPTLAEQIAVPRAERQPALELELEAAGGQEPKIAVAEHDSALELAEIMLSFGRVQGAAQTLTDYIHANPRQAIRPWLKLLDIYHGAGMQNEFDATMEQFHQNFNVQSVGWSDYRRELNRASVEGMPHLIQEVIASWPSSGCLELLQNYLRDNREGTRNGFPLSIADDIATLIGVLEARHQAAAQAAR